MNLLDRAQVSFHLPRAQSDCTSSTPLLIAAVAHHFPIHPLKMALGPEAGILPTENHFVFRNESFKAVIELALENKSVRPKGTG